MSAETKIALDTATTAPSPEGRISVKLGEQAVDIQQLSKILTEAGEAIERCFGTTDSTEQVRRRAERAEAKLERIADLVNFHGSLMRHNGRDVMVLDWDHVKQIMNAPTPEE